MNKNPIRKWFAYNGRMLTAVSEAPAIKAIGLYNKLFLVNAGISLAVSAAIVGVGLVGYKVYEKLEERKDK